MPLKSCYADSNRAIIDLCGYGNGMMITRINVPAAHRGMGNGSRLLRRVLAEADANHVILYLEILPSGPLGYNALVEWYKRYGFRYWRGIWRRDPQEAK